MKNLSLVLVCIVLTSFYTFSQNQSAAPEIISTIPEFGDCNVDVDLKEIIVKFDQAMTPGMSVVDTRDMPKITGKVKWIDDKTLIIPVELYPNKLYNLAFNNSRFSNFRSVKGIPLNPDELIFKTKQISFAQKNKDAYQELLKIFPSRYSYANLKNIDWLSVLNESKTELENSETNTEFALKLVKLLKPANDPHLLVEVEGRKFETGKMSLVVVNNGAKQPFSVLQNKIVGKGFATIAGNLDSVAYFAIRDWNTDFFNIEHKRWGNSSTKCNVDSVLAAIFSFPDLIIDVRDNRGGNESIAKKLASYFITDSTPYELVKYYNEKSGLFDKEHIKTLYPNNETKYAGNIYVISGPAEMSSNESFILMMKEVPNSTIIGMKTYGSSGNPKPHKLSNGVTLYLPSWQAYTLSGKLIEGEGIEPDIEFNTTPEDFKETDPIIDKIMELTKAK